jgi:cytochrome P450
VDYAPAGWQEHLKSVEDKTGVVEGERGGMTIATEQVTGARRASASVSTMPPSLPPGGEEQWSSELAQGVMARGRGVDKDLPWTRRAAQTLVRALSRLFAPVFGFLVTGLVFALIGAYFGLRFALRGKVFDLGWFAKLVHKYQPFLALPEAIRHYAFGLVIVARHADIRALLERNDVFRVDIYDDRMRATSGAFFLGMDPGGAYDGEQKIGRNVFGTSFDVLREFTRKLCAELVNAAERRPSKTIDVVSELAQLVPVAVLREYFGIEDTQDERLRTWLQATGFFIFNFWMGGVYRVRAAEAGAELAAHLATVVERRDQTRRSGGALREDVLSRMLLTFAPTPKDQLSDEQRAFVVRTLGGLVSGTTVPTIGLSVGVINRLLELRGDKLQDLRTAAKSNDDERVGCYVREAGRFCTYPPMLYRHAAKPYAFDPGGKHATTVQRGALVVAAPFLANHDPAVFANPETFDPDRKELDQVMLFGWDRHRCLGEYVGQMIVTEIVKALFAHKVRRIAGPAGRVQNGARGAIPECDFPARLVVRLD